MSFFLEKIFAKNAAKTVARKKRICYNHQVIAARTADMPRDTNRIRPCGQAVKTAPSHGAIPGSIPGKVTIKKMSTHRCAHFFVLTTLPGRRDDPAVRPIAKQWHEGGQRPQKAIPRLRPKYSRCRGLDVCLLIFLYVAPLPGGRGDPAVRARRLRRSPTEGTPSGVSVDSRRRGLDVCLLSFCLR